MIMLADEKMSILVTHQVRLQCPILNSTFYLFNKVNDIVVHLVLSVFNSFNFFVDSCSGIVKITSVEKPQLKLNSLKTMNMKI